MRKAIRRGDLFYADLNPVVGSSKAASALSLLSKMMWGITLVLPLLQQPSPAEKRRTVCLPISYLRMCRGLRLPLCFCWNNCGQ